MRWNDYPIVRLVFPFILGIIAFTFWAKPLYFIIWIFFLLVFLLLLFSYFKKLYLPYKYRIVTGSIIYFVFFSLGFIAAEFHFPFETMNYYGNFVGKSKIAIARLIEEPKESAKTYKLEVEIESMKDETTVYHTVGKAILYVKKDDKSAKFHYGDKIIFKNTLVKGIKPNNPNAFDYNNYLTRRGIKFTAYVKSEDWKLISRQQKWEVKDVANKLRKKILIQFQKNGISGDEYAVAASLILGYRDDLSDDLTSAYRSAGVMHILCVSGMHVGIIYLIVSFLLGFLKGFKKGALLRLILILLNIWAFAIITGLSPSVTRAAVMFTFVSIGQNINRNVNIYNTLAASALMILTFDPFYIFDIGFLLSYIAVISIATFYDSIYSLWVPYNKILDRLWQIAAVSIAAQIGTAPLTIFLFHQFPNYFLISNIVVILAIVPIFYLTLSSLVFSFIPPLASWLSTLSSWMIGALNYFVIKIQNMPFAVTEHISFSAITLLLSIILIISLSVMLIRKRPNWIFVNLSLIILILANSIYENEKTIKIDRIVIFNIPNHTALLFHSGTYSAMAVDSAAFHHKESIKFSTDGYLQKFALQPEYINLDSNYNLDAKLIKIGDFLVYKNKIIAIINTNKFLSYNKTLACKYLIIKNKKQFSIDKKLAQYLPEAVILSNELWPKQIEKFEAKLEEQNYKFVDLRSSGALIENF